MAVRVALTTVLGLIAAPLGNHQPLPALDGPRHQYGGARDPLTPALDVMRVEPVKVRFIERNIWEPKWKHVPGKEAPLRFNRHGILKGGGWRSA